jgi:hypothetical protein
MKVADDGFISESFRNQRLSEKDIDEACLLALFVIFLFLVLNQLPSSLVLPILLKEILVNIS